MLRQSFSPLSSAGEIQHARQRKDDDSQGQIRAVEAEVEDGGIGTVSRYLNQPSFLDRGALESCDETVTEKPRARTPTMVVQRRNCDVANIRR